MSPTRVARRGPKSAQTRERILTAAATVLAERGVDATRLSHIADAVGMAGPALYYHFASRDDLVDEVMQLGARRCREHLEAVLAAASGADPVERIRLAAEGHLRVTLELSDVALAATRNMRQLPDRIRWRQLAEQERYGELWRALVDDAHRAGLLAPGLDPGAARMYVLGALNWVPEWWDPAHGDLDHLVRSMAAMTVAALTGPGPAIGG